MILSKHGLPVYIIWLLYKSYDIIATKVFYLLIGIIEIHKVNLNFVKKIVFYYVIVWILLIIKWLIP